MRTNYRPELQPRLSVNGNLDKFNYYASLNSTETTEFLKRLLPAAIESDRFPE
jgi:vitamin B12 transporter